MTAAELIVLLEGAPPNAVVVTHDGGHDAEEVGTRGVEFVLPDLYADILEEVLARARAEGARSSRSTSAALSWDTDALDALYDHSPNLQQTPPADRSEEIDLRVDGHQKRPAVPNI